jgi:hypothetical protein
MGQYEYGIADLDARVRRLEAQLLGITPEAEAGEWVEIDTYTRIRADGSQPQVNPNGEWLGAGANHCWVDAYRAGRSVALEQVQELVEAVLDYSLVVASERDWREIVELAEKVKL